MKQFQEFKSTSLSISRWHHWQTVYYREPSTIYTNSDIIGFDVFNTLIRSASGSRFPKDRTDWVWTGASNTPRLIANLLTTKRLVVFFSNLINDSSTDMVKDIIEQMISDINTFIISSISSSQYRYEPYVFLSVRKDENAKPSPGMWKLFRYLLSLSFINPSSFYTGDRDDDEGFARNSGLVFSQLRDTLPVPPDIVVKTNKGDFNISQEIRRSLSIQQSPNEMMFEKAFGSSTIDTSQSNVLVIMVGQQGSGKTTFSNLLGQLGFVIISKVGKYMVEFQSNLRSRKNIVIDATNPSVLDRTKFIEEAVPYGIPIYIVFASRSGEASNNLRGSQKVPSIALRAYTSNFSKPLSGAIIYQLN